MARKPYAMHPTRSCFMRILVLLLLTLAGIKTVSLFLAR